MPDYAAARRNMVDNQLRPNRIDDPRIIKAMLDVPRELFVPKPLRGVAYGDDDLDLGDGRRLIEPLALGKLLQGGTPRPPDIGLVVGCDTGYVAAILARLVATVFLLLPEGREASIIERTLTEVGGENVVLQHGQLADGLPSQAPFDLILLAGAVAEPPALLLEQLSENGRLVAVVQNHTRGHVTICHKFNGVVGRLTPYDAWLPELAALRAPPHFVL